MIITPDHILLEEEDFPPVDVSKGQVVGLRLICTAELFSLGGDDDDREIAIPIDPTILSIDYIYEGNML